MIEYTLPVNVITYLGVCTMSGELKGLIVCYKELFTQNGIKYNIASYSIISIILFHIIVIIFFYYKLKIDLDNKIKDIIFSIKNWYLVRADRKLKKQIKLKNETEIKDENINNENSKKSKNLNLNNQKQKEKNKLKSKMKILIMKIARNQKI